MQNKAHQRNFCDEEISQKLPLSTNLSHLKKLEDRMTKKDDKDHNTWQNPQVPDESIYKGKKNER